MISVIIPAFNCEKTISKCIDSALAQRNCEMEILIVNDGSSDNTEKICEEYACNYCNIKIINQRNSGVSSARNTGINSSTGEYLFFLDSDDELLADSIFTMVQILNDSECDLVCGGIMIQRKDLSFSCLSQKTITKSGSEIIDDLANPLFTSCCGKIFKRDVLGAIKFDECHRINEDCFFMFQYLLKCKKVIATDVMVYKYLYHENSASHCHFSEKYYDILYFRDRRIAELDKLNIDTSNVKARIFLQSSIELYNKFILADSKREERKQLLKEIRSHKIVLRGMATKKKISIFLLIVVPALYDYLFRKKYE